jgi:hypothetical protein
MTLIELRSEVDRYRRSLVSKAGSVVEFSESGPAGMLLIDSLVQLAEVHEQRILNLEQKIADLERRPSTFS